MGYKFLNIVAAHAISRQVEWSRHCVMPGITGWAQINYKYGDSLDDAIMKLEFDLYYIKNLAVWLDLFIILHTLKVVLFSETAQ